MGIYVRNLARDWKFTIRSGSKRRCQEAIGTQKGSVVLGMNALTIHQSRIHRIKWGKSLGPNLEELQYLKIKRRRRRIRNWEETKKCRRETQKIENFEAKAHKVFQEIDNSQLWQSLSQVNKNPKVPNEFSNREGIWFQGVVGAESRLKCI